jgi:DNA-binding transcriptional ArsR family regulator
VIHPFELLADPVRRRIVEVLAVGDHRAGEIGDVVSYEFGISRTAVSHQLRTLREHGVVTSAVDSSEPRARRYRLDSEFLARLDDAVGHLFDLWDHRYGSFERRAPIPPSTPTRPSRVHRLGRAAARRVEADAARWTGDEG